MTTIQLLSGQQQYVVYSDVLYSATFLIYILFYRYYSETIIQKWKLKVERVDEYAIHVLFNGQELLEQKGKNVKLPPISIQDVFSHFREFGQIHEIVFTRRFAEAHKDFSKYLKTVRALKDSEILNDDVKIHSRTNVEIRES